PEEVPRELALEKPVNFIQPPDNTAQTPPKDFTRDKSPKVGIGPVIAVPGRARKSTIEVKRFRQLLGKSKVKCLRCFQIRLTEFRKTRQREPGGRSSSQLRAPGQQRCLPDLPRPFYQDDAVAARNRRLEFMVSSPDDVILRVHWNGSSFVWLVAID